MPQDPNEWKALKDQFEELRRHQSESVPDIERIFDTQIRLRFGEMIYRAIISTSKRLKD
jgi:hypothetical protein